MEVNTNDEFNEAGILHWVVISMVFSQTHSEIHETQFSPAWFIMLDMGITGVMVALYLDFMDAILKINMATIRARKKWKHLFLDSVQHKVPRNV